MKKIQIILLIVLTGVVGCQSLDSSSWPKGMRGMADTFNALVPYIYDDDRYSDPHNKKFIEPKLDDLLFYSSRLDKHIGRGLSGNDPLFDLGLKELKKSIGKAVDSYRVDSFEYSQNLLQSSINYCVKCHTRTYLGPSFARWDNFSKPQGMKPVDLAKIYIATREFEKSMDTLEDAIVKARNKSEKMKALKLMVTVGLKNMNSSKDTGEYLKRVSSKEKDKNFKRLIQKWMGDLKSWEKLESRSITESLFKIVSRSSNKDVNYVKNLSYTVVLHKNLMGVKSDEKRAKVYYSLGKIYSANRSMSFTALPDLYFESCIKKFPHSNIAKKCYYALEMDMKRSYKLESGKLTPSGLDERLKKLKVLTEKLKVGVSPSFGREEL